MNLTYQSDAGDEQPGASIPAELLHQPGHIRTVSGIMFSVLDPGAHMVKIEDIAHALSMLPRFGGHLPEFYSVAQHCVRCAHLAPESLKLDALMHDAAEAYVMDLPRPIKYRMPEYKAAENRIFEILAYCFKLSDPIPKKVKIIDEFMLIQEWQQLALGRDPKDPKDLLVPWTRETAKANFLRIFKKYQR